MNILPKLTISFAIPCMEAMLGIFCPCIYFTGGDKKKNKPYFLRTQQKKTAAILTIYVVGNHYKPYL